MPTILLSFLPIFANAALIGLQNSGVLSTATAALVSGIEQSILPLFQKLQAGNSTSTDVLAGMAAGVGILQALKSEKGLPQNVLDRVSADLTSVEAGIAGFLTAEKGVDVSTLTQLQPVA